MSIRSRTLILAGVLFALVAPATPVLGQTFPLDPVDAPAFVVHWEKPFLEGADRLAAWSSILELDAVLPVGDAVSLAIGLPFSLLSSDFDDDTHLYAGALRATLLFGEPGDPTGFLGVTFPTATAIAGDDEGGLFAAIPWWNEREKWVDESWSVRGALTPSKPLNGGGRIGLRLGGALVLLNGGDNLDADLRVSGWLRRPAGNAEIRADLAGTYAVTSDDGFREQSTLFLNLGADLPETGGNPGVFVRLPLYGVVEDLHELSIGLKVAL